jgi:hypothetical protein
VTQIFSRATRSVFGILCGLPILWRAGVGGDSGVAGRGRSPGAKTKPYCPVPLSARRICLPRPAHPDAGRGSVVQHDQAEVGDHGADHQPLEAALPCFGDGRPGYESSRTVGFGADCEAASPNLSATRKTPKVGSSHWSCRKLAAAVGVSKDAVHRVWKEAGLKPHRLQRYMASDDPDLKSKAADIIGLYLNPPQHAAVFCVDEKTAIQALDRLDPMLPLSPGRAERHGFEHYRHGTLSLYAALDTAAGRVHGKTAARHTSRDFVVFLKEVVALCPPDQQIHIILDNLSAHKTAGAGVPGAESHFLLKHNSNSEFYSFYVSIEMSGSKRICFVQKESFHRKRGYEEPCKPRWNGCPPLY